MSDSPNPVDPFAALKAAGAALVAQGAASLPDEPEAATLPMLGIPAADAPAELPAAAVAPSQAIAEPIAAPSAAARIVSSKPRSRRVPLAWPVEYLGQLHVAIMVARPSTLLVASYYETVQALPEDAAIPRFPVFYDEAGAPIPDAVLDAMDDDDATLVFGAVADFLPVRLRLLTGGAPELSPPMSGDDTEQKLSAS